MRKVFFWLTMVCAVALLATPAAADQTEDAPPQPKYELTQDGILVVGGDVRVDCRSYVLFDKDSRLARLCEEQGFSLPSSAARETIEGSESVQGAVALPETGGPSMGGLALLGAVGGLVYGSLVIRTKGR